MRDQSNDKVSARMSRNGSRRERNKLLKEQIASNESSQMEERKAESRVKQLLRFLAHEQVRVLSSLLYFPFLLIKNNF